MDAESSMVRYPFFRVEEVEKEWRSGLEHHWRKREMTIKAISFDDRCPSSAGVPLAFEMADTLKVFL